MSLPTPLPPVRGRGSLARALSITWSKFNELRSFVETLQPRPGYGTKVTHTSSGFSIEADKKTTNDSSSGGTARWA